jgi:hypothetical protein
MRKFLFFASLNLALMILFGVYVNAQNFEKPQTELSSVIEATAPNFPSSAASLGLSSKISAEVRVDSEGKVTNIKIISGHPLFKWEVERVSDLWLFETSTEKVRYFNLFFDFIFVKYDGKEDKQVISFKPPFAVKIVKMVPLKELPRIPHPPAIINLKKKSSK